MAASALAKQLAGTVRILGVQGHVMGGVARGRRCLGGKISACLSTAISKACQCPRERNTQEEDGGDKKANETSQHSGANTTINDAVQNMKKVASVKLLLLRNRPRGKLSGSKHPE